MSKKILLVDDDPTLIKLVQSFLESQGYKVSVAGDGQTGIELAQKDTPDLIVLDVSMPRMNGYTFIFELKKIKSSKAIPIIVLTAKEGMAEIFKVEGVREYITKPFKPEVLLTAIKKHVEPA
ncbi:MAG: response regulator transcription factor [Candidatus Omnitrophica bacterium]|nr:response regulator transcription factor [Candidatus Omnitrophota bacterium]